MSQEPWTRDKVNTFVTGIGFLVSIAGGVAGGYVGTITDDFVPDRDYPVRLGFILAIDALVFVWMFGSARQDPIGFKKEFHPCIGAVVFAALALVSFYSSAGLILAAAICINACLGWMLSRWLL